jgi:hypothetical protein
MLKELLLEIKHADYISTWILAEKLDQPAAVIRDGLAQLIRLGYLKEDGSVTDCERPCGACPYARFCNKVPVTTMMITEKGEKLLKRQ